MSEYKFGLEGMVNRAFHLQVEAHEGQQYGREPYSNHPFEVANLARYMGYGHVVIATCLLHDTVEDTDVSLEVLADEGFPESVVKGVDGVTFIDEVDNPNGLTGEERRALKIGKAMRNPVSHITKFVDSTCNFANTALYPWQLDKDDVGPYIEDYVGNLAELKNGLLAPAWVEDYAMNVDGRMPIDNDYDLSKMATRNSDWARIASGIMFQRFEFAKLHYEDM